MKKKYIAPATTMVAVATQQIMAASGIGDGRYSDLPGEWNNKGVGEVTDPDEEFEHGQSSTGGGSRAKRHTYNVWEAWDD